VKRWLRILISGGSLILLLVALAMLRDALRHHHYHEIAARFGEIPATRVAAGILLTALSYWILTGYDLLGLRFLRRKLPYRKTAFASFTGYAFSHTLGFSPLTGGAIRFRLYTHWGLSPTEITSLIAFAGTTYWLGFAVAAGMVFLGDPPPVPLGFHAPSVSVRLFGTLLLLAAMAYLAASLRRRGRPLIVRGWEAPLASPGIAGFQLTLGAIDWAVSAAALFVLLPADHGLTFASFLGVYLLAQVVGVASQVPGGLGVFESAVVLLLAPALPADRALGSLLAFRILYYLLPLILATLALGAHELAVRRSGLARMVGRWVPSIIPHAFALTTFIAGTILLLSGATPAGAGRLAFLRDLVPLPVVEVSHLAGSMIGAILMILAWGLERRLDAAYVLTLLMLGAGVVASLLKGLDWEEALILAAMFAALVPCHRSFFRKASLTAEPLGAGWLAASFAVLAGSAAVAMFAFRHVEYTSDLWWHFAFRGEAPRSLRAVVGAFVILTLAGAARLLRPARPKPGRPSAEGLERAREIARASPATSGYLALLGDKAMLFSKSRRAFLMYAVEGRSWVSMGDPVGPVEEWPELAWEFRETAHRGGGWTVFYQVGAEHLPLYLDLGLTLSKLGEEARVPLTGFSLEGGTNKAIRQHHHRAARDGASFEWVGAERVPDLLPELRAISDSWLENKKTREKGFSLGFFDERYLSSCPAAIVRFEGRLVAFANVLLGGEHEELSVDLMRYGPGAPPGVMEFLIVELLLWGNAEGYRWFNLGMSPFAGMPDHALASLRSRVGAFAFRYGEEFYNFQGIRAFKEKFHPVWQPRYLASPGGFALAGVLANVAALVSRGIKGVVSK
jgi:phosphatidylglycerol lysyltransferase